MPAYRSEVMVGRERELTALRELAHGALDGRSASALVIGEAGVGKSRLVAELVAALASGSDGAGWVCAVSHGVELAGGELPFGATAELLRSLARSPGLDAVRRAAGPDAQVLASVLPSIGRAPPTVGVDRAAVMGAVLTVLESLGRPVCWVVDDLHWVDAASRDLFAYLSRVLGDASVLLVATVRTDAATPDQVPSELLEVGRQSSVLPMPPLTPRQVATLVEAIPGHHLDAAQVARIGTVSDGLPFFVEQLVASDGRISGSLRGVVLAGLESLSPGARILLSAAAVGEGMLAPAYLREVCALGEAFPAALEEVREHAILRPDGERGVLAFRHALLREAVDSWSLAAERRELHRAWGDVLDRALEDSPGDRRLVMERARHRYAAGGTDAFPAVVDAARAADVSDDDRIRATWWRRTIELWPADGAGMPLIERDRALAKYLEALWAVAEPGEILDVLERELDQPQDWIRRLWLQLHRRHTRRAMQLSADSPVPIEDAETTVARLLAIASDFRVPWLLVHLAFDWFVDSKASGPPELEVRMLEEAIRRADPALDAPVVVIAYGGLGRCEAVSGDHEGEVACMRRAVAWTQAHCPSAVLSARVDLSGSLVWAGHYAEAIALGDTNLAEIRDPALRPHLWVLQHLVLAVAHLSSDDWDRAAQALDLAATDACGGDIGAFRDLLLATLHARRGDLPAARAHLAAIPASATDARQHELGFELSLREFASLEIAVTEADSDVARAGVLRVIDLIRPEEPPGDVWEAAATGLRAAVERGAQDPAARGFLAVATRELAARGRAGRVIAMYAAQVEAHLDRAEDSDTADQWAIARGLCAGLGRSYDAAWCALFEAECAERDGDRERARRALRSARTTCTRLGAAPLLERVGSTARRWRLDGVVDARPEGGLTSRETEVLRLLADGLTNAQIAERLFMSPKTASVHVSHIIAKLGVANRTEAAARAHRTGVVGPA